MWLTHWILGAGSALALSVLAASAQAAPAGPAAGIRDLGVSVAEKAAYRRCWRHRGKRHCRWYRGSSRAYSGYYEHDSNSLLFGSRRWVDQMDREGRFGRPSR